jgi:light-regulated signal transduction histidine kinase (bacteriophytochrome)
MAEPRLSDARLMFGFAHDMRAFLRTIVTRVQMVQLGGAALLSEPDREFLEEANVAASDMNRLLSAMVSYYDVAPSTETMRLRLIIRGVLMECKALLNDADASVTVKNDLDVPVTTAFQTVLKELLTNSCRFRRRDEKTLIEIQARQPDPHCLEVAVSDNGLGVDDECLDRIFLPFQRMHSRSEFPGFGLGLALCERIVSVHGGTIAAAASPAGGLSVTLRMPMVPNGSKLPGGRKAV